MLINSQTLTPASTLALRFCGCFSHLRGCVGSLGRRLLLAGCVLAPVVDAATFEVATAIATAAVGDSIPTRLVLPVGVDEVPSPVCSQCKAGTRKVSANGGASTTGAMVTFTFGDYGLYAYIGVVQITVRLNDGSYREVNGNFMTILDGQTVAFDLGNGDDWTWDEDVELVFFALTDVQ